MSSSTEFEPSTDPSSSPTNTSLLVVGGGGGGGGNFEHPLTAATTAMLNINGASEDSPGGGFNVFYDIYGKNLSGSELLKSDHRGGDIWSPVQPPKLSNNGEMTEVFVSSASSPLNPKLTSSVLRSNPGSKLKLNGHAPNTDGGVIVVKQEELHHPHSPSSPSSRLNGILGVADNGATGGDGYPAFATLNPSHYTDYSSVISSSPQQFSLRGASIVGVGGPIYSTEPYYRDYFPPDYVPSNATRVISGYDGPTGVGGGQDNASYRIGATLLGGPYKNPVTIDVNSPDSGIGAESITPRDHSSTAQPGFDYGEMVGQGLMGEMSGASSNAGSATGRSTPASNTPNQKATRPWHEFGRTSETDKIQIPKLFLNCGFRYYLESPISTSQRREDDRITYINKGQFYGITLDFLPDQEKPLKHQTVKSVVMLVFREEKSPEDEIKAWQFWHSRQHSVKQRILDADTKNSVGLVGCIDEVSHNAIAVYWNPLESSAKINVAVQCLSTDFSSQKGVKGLPLHLQIDTYDDPRDPNCPIYHRAYSQIKVFCDKGAERKTRDEERRAAKRKLTATGRKKLDELYHTPAERTEFYAMSDLAKPPVLFSPAEDLDKVNLTPLAEFHGYYGGGGGGANNGGGSTNSEVGSESPNVISNNPTPNARRRSSNSRPSNNSSTPSPRPRTPTTGTRSNNSNTLKFHHTFPPDSPPTQFHHHEASMGRRGSSSIIVRIPKQEKLHHSLTKESSSSSSSLLDHHSSHLQPHHHTHDLQQQNQQLSHHHLSHQDLDPNSSLHQQQGLEEEAVIPMKRLRSLHPSNERLMIYVRQEGEDVFTPVHLAPPTTLGLLAALEDKFKISMSSVKNLLRRSGKGVVAKVDDEMLKHYCHEDTFLLEVKASENEDAFDVTLAELCMEIVSHDMELDHQIQQHQHQELNHEHDQQLGDHGGHMDNHLDHDDVGSLQLPINHE